MKEKERTEVEIRRNREKKLEEEENGGILQKGRGKEAKSGGKGEDREGKRKGREINAG